MPVERDDVQHGLACDPLQDRGRQGAGLLTHRVPGREQTRAGRVGDGSGEVLGQPGRLGVARALRPFRRAAGSNLRRPRDPGELLGGGVHDHVCRLTGAGTGARGPGGEPCHQGEDVCAPLA